MNKNVTIGIVLGVIAVVALLIAGYLVFRYWRTSTSEKKSQLTAEKIDPYNLIDLSASEMERGRRHSARRSRIQSLVTGVRKRATALFNLNKPLPPPPPGYVQELPYDVDEKIRNTLDDISVLLDDAKRETFQLPPIRSSIFSIRPAKLYVNSGASTPVLGASLVFPLPPGSTPQRPLSPNFPDYPTNTSATLVPPFALQPGGGRGLGLGANTMYRKDAPVPPEPAVVSPATTSFTTSGYGGTSTPTDSVSSGLIGANVVIAQRSQLLVPKLANVPRSRPTLQRKKEVKYKQPRIDDFPAPPPFPPPNMPVPPAPPSSYVASSASVGGQDSPTDTAFSGQTGGTGSSFESPSTRIETLRPPGGDRGSLLPIQAPSRSASQLSTAAPSTALVSDITLSGPSRNSSHIASVLVFDPSRRSSSALPKSRQSMIPRRQSTLQVRPSQAIRLPLNKTASGDFDISSYYQSRASEVWVSSPMTELDETQ